MNNVIVAQDIWKSFQISKNQEVNALRGLHLEIRRGEFVSIMGPSGSGKSTLLNLIGCIDTPSKGRLNVLGENTTGMAENALSTIRAERIGFIFQSFNLLSSLSVIDNVELVMRFRRKKEGRLERINRAKELLQTMGLEDRLGQSTKDLSGGEKQRVAIVRALANNPEILLADEPTGNLDSQITKEIIELLHDINKNGTTVIMVTHNKDTTTGTRVLNLIDGQIA